MRGRKKNNFVFIISLVLSLTIIGTGLWDIQRFSQGTRALLLLVEGWFSPVYLIGIGFFVVFCILLAASPLGEIRLGPADSVPEYSVFSWFAMLFAAGMGVGLVFWGVSEPLSHYIYPPEGMIAGTAEAKAFAIRACFLHWGIHPWACYAIIGMGLAFFGFRKKKPMLPSSIFPDGGSSAGRLMRSLIDILAVFVTVIGTAASLGMGTLQISGGLSFLFDVPIRKETWLAVIAIVCCIYLASSVSGIGKGIQVLSNINLVIAVILLLLVMALVPFQELLFTFFHGVKDYLIHFIPDSLPLAHLKDSWTQDWTIFYWAWWISWAPFVGVFIARISKGRKIREFVMGVLIVPMLVSLIWFAAFGTMALHMAGKMDGADLIHGIKQPEMALFFVFEMIPAGKYLSVLAIVLIIIFFITSADSATFVLSMLTSGGDTDPPNSKKFVWGILQAVMAYILLLSGGVQSLQTAAIVAAFPFVVIMCAMCISLVRALLREEKKRGERDCRERD